jgi:hypothetical protein
MCETYLPKGCTWQFKEQVETVSLGQELYRDICRFTHAPQGPLVVT